MSIRDPKNKTISFRLSQQEYVVADQARQERNFENMSVFARCAVLAYSSTPLGAAMDAAVESMKQRLDAVVQQIADLTKRFEER
jgi:hypothetical protein